MRIADELRLPAEQRADLYYAELLMDAGCTAWTSHLAAAILGDEIDARRELVFFSDTRNPVDMLGWMKEYMAARGSHAREGPAGRELRRSTARSPSGRAFRNTCEVAQRFALRLGMPGRGTDGSAVRLRAVGRQRTKRHRAETHPRHLPDRVRDELPRGFPSHRRAAAAIRLAQRQTGHGL